MRYSLHIEYTDGTIIHGAPLPSAELIADLVERIADNNEHRHVDHWTITPEED